MTGVIASHVVILTGICFTGGCNSTPVLEPRPFIPAPESKKAPIIEEKIPEIPEIPEVTINQTVTQPVTPEPPPFKLDSPAENIVYTVQKNDSFWKIARKHGVTMQSLAAYNNMSLNKVLKVGEKLKIPPGGYVVKNITPVKTSIKSRKTSSVKVKPQARPTDGTYTVKSGDSFWKIAKKYNLKTKTLLDANKMTGKETLQIGQKLIIPDGKSSVASAPAETKTIVTKEDASLKSILDTVDAGEEVKAPAVQEVTKIETKETPQDVKDLIEDTKVDDYDAGDRAVQVIKDIKVEDFAKQYKVTPEMLKKLNEDYPADGVFKAGSVVIIRSME
jgi:LysM repeat protein